MAEAKLLKKRTTSLLPTFPRRRRMAAVGGALGDVNAYGAIARCTGVSTTCAACERAARQPARTPLIARVSRRGADRRPGVQAGAPNGCGYGATTARQTLSAAAFPSRYDRRHGDDDGYGEPAIRDSCERTFTHDRSPLHAGEFCSVFLFSALGIALTSLFPHARQVRRNGARFAIGRVRLVLLMPASLGSNSRRGRVRLLSDARRVRAVECRAAH